MYKSQTMLALSSLNNLWSVVAGKRYSHDHPHLQNLLRIVNDFMQEGQVRLFLGIRDVWVPY